MIVSLGFFSNLFAQKTATPVATLDGKEVFLTDAQNGLRTAVLKQYPENEVDPKKTMQKETDLDELEKVFRLAERYADDGKITPKIAESFASHIDEESGVKAKLITGEQAKLLVEVGGHKAEVSLEDLRKRATEMEGTQIKEGGDLKGLPKGYEEMLKHQNSVTPKATFNGKKMSLTDAYERMKLSTPENQRPKLQELLGNLAWAAGDGRTTKDDIAILNNIKNPNFALAVKNGKNPTFSIKMGENTLTTTTKDMLLYMHEKEGSIVTEKTGNSINGVYVTTPMDLVNILSKNTDKSVVGKAIATVVSPAAYSRVEGYEEAIKTLEENGLKVEILKDKGSGYQVHITGKGVDISVNANAGTNRYR